MINNRIQQFETNGIKERNKTHPVNQLFFTVPHVNGISERFKNLTKKHNFNLSFLTTNSEIYKNRKRSIEFTFVL